MDLNLIDIAVALEKKGLVMDYSSAVTHDYLGISGLIDNKKFYISYKQNIVVCLSMEIKNKVSLEIVLNYMVDILGYTPSFFYKLTDTPVIVYEWHYIDRYKPIRMADLTNQVKKCEITSLINLEKK